MTNIQEKEADISCYNILFHNTSNFTEFSVAAEAVMILLMNNTMTKPLQYANVKRFKGNINLTTVALGEWGHFAR